MPNDTFVTSSNLTASRPRPVRGALLERLANNPTVVRLVAFGYIGVILLFWGQIRTIFSPASLAETIPRTEAIWFGLIIAIPFTLILSLNAFTRQRRTHIPFYRNLDTIRDMIQIMFVIVTFYALALLIINLLNNLGTSGLTINFRALLRDYGTEVSEGPDPRADWSPALQAVPLVGEWLAQQPIFTPDTNFRALFTGFQNTLRVVWLSLVASTLLGVLLGVGLLTPNWLLRNISGIYVEIFRNTPLLVQLFFIYSGFIRVLPSRPDEALVLIPNVMYLSGRGIYYPRLIETPSSDWFYGALWLGVGLVGLVGWWRVRVNEQTGRPANLLQYALGSIVLLGGVGYALAWVSAGNPIAFEFPTASRFNFSGGQSLSGEYLGLFLGLSLYTSAFIADIVRAGIQSVPYGQIEASRALGLTNNQTLMQIILPQALRLAVPPLTNQYLNLAKNSSLGIAIGFTDLYTVANIANNQSGQTVVMFVVLMVTYLGLSLFISFFMNIFNRTLKLRAR